MRRDDAGALEEMERGHQLSELVRRTRRALSMNRPDQAQKLAAEVVELAPDTTTAEELLGDVAMAQGRFVEARRHFERALEIEPINADAERKLGEAVLRIGGSVRLKERMEEAVENPEEYSRFRRTPLVAAAYSVVPGFGQLYNQQYEKGLAMTAVAMALLAWVLSELLGYSGTSLISEAPNPSLDTARARELLAQQYDTLWWVLIILAIAAYMVLWVYSVWDAYMTCKRMAREADELGIEM